MIIFNSIASTVLHDIIQLIQRGDIMFELDLRSRVPIYEQLVAKIKALIINDVMKADEQLPPVRVLAAELTINPNTIQKAYRELEHQGYICSIPGKGHFVMAAVREQSVKLEKLKQDLARIAAEMFYLGMSQQDIMACIQDSIAMKQGGCEGHD